MSSVIFPESLYNVLDNMKIACAISQWEMRFIKSQSYDEYIFRKFHLGYNKNGLEVTNICGKDPYIVFPIVVWIASSRVCPRNALQICKTLGLGQKTECCQQNRIFYSIKQTISYRDKTFNLGFISLVL